MSLVTMVESLVPALGVAGAREKIKNQLLEGMKADEGSDAWRRFSIRELWDAFVGRVPVAGHHLVEAEHVSSSFSVIAGNVIAKAIVTGFESEQRFIGDRLITKSKSTTPVDTYAGVQSVEDPDALTEGETIPFKQFEGEKSLQPPEPLKRGLRIGLSREMVLFDRTNALLAQASDIGKVLRRQREKQIINTLADAAGYTRYYPKTTGGYAQTAVYRAAAGSEWYNRHITALTGNALGGTGSIQTAMSNLATRTDESGNTFGFVPKVIVVPFALAQSAWETIRATQYVKGTTAAENRLQGPNATVLNAVIGGIPDVLVSPLLDAISTTQWYIGDPQACLVEQIHWPISVFKAADSHPDNFDRDIIVQWKATRKADINWIRDDFILRSAA